MRARPHIRSTPQGCGSPPAYCPPASHPYSNNALLQLPSWSKRCLNFIFSSKYSRNASRRVQYAVSRPRRSWSYSASVENASELVDRHGAVAPLPAEMSERTWSRMCMLSAREAVEPWDARVRRASSNSSSVTEMCERGRPRRDADTLCAASRCAPSARRVCIRRPTVL